MCMFSDCREAYTVACLGVTTTDWNVLATEALEVSAKLGCHGVLLVYVAVNIQYGKQPDDCQEREILRSSKSFVVHCVCVCVCVCICVIQYLSSP